MRLNKDAEYIYLITHEIRTFPILPDSVELPHERNPFNSRTKSPKVILKKRKKKKKRTERKKKKKKGRRKVDGRGGGGGGTVAEPQKSYQPV